MYQISTIQRAILRMFNQASSSVYARTRLITYLETLIDAAPNTAGSVIATTLLGKLDKYAEVYCSERQAKALAFTAYESFLYPEGVTGVTYYYE